MKNGQVLLSTVATKKILSYGLDANAYQFVTFNRLLQAEIGFTRNEPGSLAVEQAIEQAVLQFIVEGAARGLWAFKDRGFQSRIVEESSSAIWLRPRRSAPPPAKHASAAANLPPLSRSRRARSQCAATEFSRKLQHGRASEAVRAGVHRAAANA